MRGAERVVGRFAAPRKAGDPVALPQPRHGLAPARQDLVRIGLVAHVPDEAVLRGIEDIMQGQRQLDRPEVRGQVPARAGDRIQDEGAQLVGHVVEFAAVQPAQLRRRIDPFQ